MNRTKTFLKVAVAVLLAALPMSCDKGPEMEEEEEQKESFFIQTGIVSDYTYDSVVAHAAVKSLDGTKISSVSFRVFLDEAMNDFFQDIPATKGSDGEYSATIDKLTYDTDYYYSCRVTSEDGTEHNGAVRKFTSMAAPVNEVQLVTLDADDIQRYSAKLGGKVYLPKGVKIEWLGITYGKTQDLKNATNTKIYTNSDGKDDDGRNSFEVTKLFDGLTKGTTYYYRLYGSFTQPNDGLSTPLTGDIKSFTTEAAVNPIWVLENTAVKTPVTTISVKTGESITLDCVNANNHNEDIYVSDCTKSHGSYITSVRSGNKLTIKGVSACTNQKITLTYKVEGTSHTTSITYSVISTDEKRRQDIRNYFFAHESEEGPVTLTIAPEPVAKYIVSNNGVMVMDSYRQSVNSDYPDYNYRPVNDDNIYPGSLVYINQNLKNGTPETVVLPCSNAAGKVNVYVTFLANGKEVSESNVPNTPDKIYAAINKLVSSALASGSVPAGSAKVKSSCSNSSSKLALDFGVSASFMKAKCSVETSTEKESTSLYAMHSFTQEFYNVKITAADNDPTNYLGTGVTADIIREVERSGRGKIGIISSVSYGRYGYYTKSFEQSKFSFKGSEKVSYGTCFDASAKQDISNLAESTEEWGYIYGGDPKVAGQALSNEADFKSKVLSSMTVAQDNQGVPMFYTVKYIGSGKDAGTNYTGSYNDISSYKPCPETLTVDMFNHIKTSGSKDVKVVLKLKVLKLTGSDVVEQPTPQEFEYHWGGREHTTQLVKAPAGCVFDGIAEIFVYTNVNDLKLNGKIDVSDGYLKISLEGSQGSPSFKKNDDLLGECDTIME